MKNYSLNTIVTWGIRTSMPAARIQSILTANFWHMRHGWLFLELITWRGSLFKQSTRDVSLRATDLTESMNVDKRQSDSRVNRLISNFL